MPLRIGMIGTSWWADSMYLPALVNHPDATVVAVCGRDTGRTRDFADRWGVPGWSTNTDDLLDRDLDAVIVATPNDTHARFSISAMRRGLHVLCEKPLATSVADAELMADVARETGATTMVPFTYRYMPSNRWVKKLIDDGYAGHPYNLSLRYFAGFGRSSNYSWRFDRSVAGEGVLGDLGSHWLDMATWLFGEIVEIGATTTHLIERGPRPDARPYEPLDDSAVITVGFANGASGILQVSSLCWEGDGFGQTHHLDVHGSDGTLHCVNDWNSRQEVMGLKAGDPGPAGPISIPDSVWAGARRGSVHDTYRDVFRVSQMMIGDFVDAALARRECPPDFAHGAVIQRLIARAAESAQSGGTMLTVGS